MASYKVLVISMMMIFVIQSAPIEKANEDKNQLLLNSDDSKTSSSTSTSTIPTVSQSSLPTPAIAKEKKKRDIDEDSWKGFLDYINDQDDSNEITDEKIDHVLHAKIQETSATVHDNADKPVETDDSRVYSDIKMTPNELTTIRRRRRDVKFNDQSNQRRKRALSPYDFYNTDSFYEPYADLIERQPIARPIRSFAPLYWYPDIYEREIRSALAPSFYESSEWPALYSTETDGDDDDEIDAIPISMLDDENNYESNRYPILYKSSDIPYDNLQLQQQYNIDDLPLDEDDDDGETQYLSFDDNEDPYYTRFGPLETYF